MENIKLSIKSSPSKISARAVLCGVVGSGNLEILIQKNETAGKNIDECFIDINTNTNGYSETWRLVLEAFTENHSVGGLRISINDMGATPAVVTLRLNQGLAAYTGAT